MLVQQEKIRFSVYFFVPKNNILRKINEMIDFSFIYDELLNKYYTNNGRTAESPVRMFKYLLLKMIYSVSDVEKVMYLISIPAGRVALYCLIPYRTTHLLSSMVDLPELIQKGQVGYSKAPPLLSYINKHLLILSR